MDEQRKHKRVNKDLRSEVHSDDSMTLSKSDDVSSGGLFISTPEPLSKGSEISLSLQIPGDEAVTIKGIVKWVRDSESDDEKSGMGIEFIDAGDHDLEKIKKLIES